MAALITKITTASNLTNADTLTFNVVFNNDVTGVAADQFMLNTGGGIADASVLEVTQIDASHYTVTVAAGTGEGTLQLLVNGTAITDVNGQTISSSRVVFDYTPDLSLSAEEVGSLGLTFTNYGTLWADMNGDGVKETYFSRDSTVFYCNGTSNIMSGVQTAVLAYAAFDYNGDSSDDLIYLGHGTGYNVIYGTAPLYPKSDLVTIDRSAAAPVVSLSSDTGSSASDRVTNVATLVATGETGSTFEYSADGSTWAASAPTAGEGLNTVYVRQTDLAGNTSAATAFSFTYDSTAPVAPSIKLAADTGKSASDRLTNNADINIGGLKAGAMVEYSGNGTDWSNQIPDAVEGTNTVYVRQTDKAGNHSAASSLSFTLDTTAPNAPPTVALTSDSGRSSTDHITNNSALTIGSASGATVKYSLNGTSWSATKPTLADGNVALHVRQVDAAGNASASTDLAFTLDTRADAGYALAYSAGKKIAGICEGGASITTSVTDMSTGIKTALGTATANASSGAWSLSSSGSWYNGSHIFRFSETAVDLAGNKDANYAWQGNSAANKFTSSTLDDRFHTGGGKDLLAFSALANGKDTIDDFVTHQGHAASTADTIQFASSIFQGSFSSLLAHTRDNAHGDAVIAYNAGGAACSLTLLGVAKADLTAADFSL